jgi:DNA-binding transcriptional MerR regulator
LTQVLSIYTAEELAQAIGVSQRTFYAYLSQGLLPEGRRIGRQVIYSTLHLHYGLLIRALVEGGVGLDAIRQILGRLSPSQVQTFAAPLSTLLETRSRLEDDLASATRQLKPAGDGLDLGDMRLEDPVALQAQMSAWEADLQHLGRQLNGAFSQVRERVLATATESPASIPVGSHVELATLRADVQALTATVRDLALIWAAQILQDEAVQEAARSAVRRLSATNELDGGDP